MSLVAIDVLRLPKILQVFMVTLYLELFCRTKYVVMPFVQAGHDGKEFLVVNLIVVFSG